MRPFEYVEPKRLSDAVAALSEGGPDAVALAGGTDLLVALKADVLRPKLVVNLKRIPGLVGIESEDGEIRLGGLTTIRTIEGSPLARDRMPALVEAAGRLGSIQIRYLATVGGNVCRAAPSAETAPPLMAMGASVRLSGPDGERTLPLEEFFTGPGRTVLSHGEVLTEIRIPAPGPRSGAAYVRHSLRPLMDLAIVNVGAWVALAEDGRSITDARIALGAVAPTPMRARQAEASLRGAPAAGASLDGAASLAAQESRPITDVRSTEHYRRAMVRLFTRRALEGALARAKGE